jgi:alcohol dehydrogenase
MSRPDAARAAVMTAPNCDLELRSFPLAAPPADGALVRIRCCTICRSDLHTWQGRRAGPLPAILGHEIVGEIVELGTQRTHDALDQRLAVGDRVTWTLHSCCGQCAYCWDRQLPMKCRQLKKYGHDACDAPPYFRGGFAEYCVLDAGTGIVKLPPELDDATAAPVNCATATALAGCEAAQLRPGDSVLIQGAGALGCYAAAYAAYSGCREVLVADVDPRRLAAARRFGATDVIDVSQRDRAELVAFVHARTRGFGVDAALETAGVPPVVGDGLASMCKGGRYVELGCSFPGAQTSLDLSLLLWNRLTLCGIHNYDIRHLRQAVDFLASAQHLFPFASVVGPRFALGQINAALQAAVTGDALRVAIVCGDRD